MDPFESYEGQLAGTSAPPGTFEFDLSIRRSCGISHEWFVEGVIRSLRSRYFTVIFVPQV